jgi:hypothetical protein
MISPHLDLGGLGEQMVQDLRDAAIEVEAICMSAPNIWDADTIEDTVTAKKGCNGTKPSGMSYGTPACPLLEMCLATALEIDAAAGVWGGKSVYERKVIAGKIKRR